MPQFLIDLQKNLKAIWGRLDAGQRLIVAAVMATGLIGLGAIVWFAGQPSYVVAFEAKTATELREAKRLLSQANVPFVPDESGQSLRVERARYGAARSAIAEGGLGAGEDRGGSLGGTIIEDSETKKWRLDNASRALAEQAIATLEGVQSATVASTRPKRSPFVSADGEVRPSATVSLRLRAGSSFEAVARSAAAFCSSQLMVPLENVTVVNAANSQHWRHDPNRAAAGGTTEFLAQQRAIGDERSLLAQEALDAIYPGKTRVTVSVELDPEWEVRSERVLTPTPVTLTDRKTNDSIETRDPSKAAADASASGVASAQPTSSTKKDNRDRTFLPDMGERKVGKLAPEVRRMSVAVLYDPSLEQKTGFGKAEFENVVKAIVGYRDGKDLLSTYAGEFVAVEVAAPASGPGLLDRVSEWAPILGQLLGVVLVLMFLKGLLKSPPRRAAVAGGPGHKPVDPAEEEKNLSAEEQQKRMRKEIERAIDADPAALAKLLESWLAEQRT